ncbi:MAG: hypothetical protein ABFD08_11765 [Syntrophomonas sp.]
MQMIIRSKRLLLGLLLCSLLIVQYLNYGIQFIAGENQFSTVSSSLAGQDSSMNDRIHTGLDFLARINNYAKLNISADGKSHGPNIKNNYSFWAAASASHAASLINYLRLSEKIYTQFYSRQIITFLHEKDGMK